MVEKPHKSQKLNSQDSQSSHKSQKPMENLLKCFEYLKPYHADMLDAIGVMIELFSLLSRRPSAFDKILECNKPLAYATLVQELESIIAPALFIQPSPKINARKIAKLLSPSQLPQDRIEQGMIEQFLHIITQKKTANKLYFYSTPYEINQLLVGILDIRPGQSVYNPCYGMGSVFLSLAHSSRAIRLYGEELDSKLSHIAQLIAAYCALESSELYVNDILAHPMFRTDSGYMRFDKILCNPPLNAHLGTQLLKDDERFSKAGDLIKSYPELVFLVHSLAHLGQRGVFIVRNQTLMKSQKRLRERLCQDGMIEAIIELPKNIFPHQSHEFSLLVISHGNDEILHIDASDEHFYAKDGKYNRLIHIDEILHLYRQRSPSAHSSLTPLSHISPQDLCAHTYVRSTQAQAPSAIGVDSRAESSAQNLARLGVEIFRGQRIYGSRNDEHIEFFDIGIADFAPCGYTEHFQSKKHAGNPTKIHKYRVRSHDILLSLRGVAPKLTILGEISATCVVNAGILVLRAPSSHVALGVYCYLFSRAGECALADLYRLSADGTIDPQNLAQMKIPAYYTSRANLPKLKAMMSELNALRDEIHAQQARIHALKSRELDSTPTKSPLESTINYR